MNVNLLSITLLTAHDSCHDDKLVLKDEVADASLVLSAHSGQVEFQRGGNLDKT